MEQAYPKVAVVSTRSYSFVTIGLDAPFGPWAFVWSRVCSLVRNLQYYLPRFEVPASSACLTPHKPFYPLASLASLHSLQTQRALLGYNPEALKRIAVHETRIV